MSYSISSAQLKTLTNLNTKVDQLLTAIECAEKDIGHRPIPDIIGELGPIQEQANEVLLRIHARQRVV